jgi:hypothetical protein
VPAGRQGERNHKRAGQVSRQHQRRCQVPSELQGGGSLSADAETADAELIALCDRFIEIERQIGGLFIQIPDDGAREAAIEPLEREQNALVARIYPTGAHGQVGIRAKARALVASAPGLVSPSANYTDSMLLASLLMDLTREDKR